VLINRLRERFEKEDSTKMLAIETGDLTKRFADRVAVDAVNLRVPSAGVFGFLGPNGAGKTTTIRMLLGLIRPDGGAVKLFGENLSEHRLGLMRRVGALVESPSLYPHLTGRENLEVTRRLLGAERTLIDRALDIVRLVKDAGRPVREYSLGMRQRLGLALALLNRPDLLILDEPTNGLDPAGIHEMRDLIRRLPVEFGITVFLSSHLLSEVEQIANHIAIVHRGRLLFQGMLDDLRARQERHVAIGVTDHEAALNCLKDAKFQVEAGTDGRLVLPGASEEDAIRANAVLVERGIGVFHLALSRTSLEDIFLAMTNEPATEDRAL
jgi:ABC-2 type transport system ATP-binding protein